jgi:hypothetical protein
MMNFTGTRKALHEALLSFIFTAIRPGATLARQREWNAVVTGYGERLVPSLKDIAHQAEQCRVMQAQANMGGAPVDGHMFDRHLIAAKSLAWAAVEDW